MSNNSNIKYNNSYYFPYKNIDTVLNNISETVSKNKTLIIDDIEQNIINDKDNAINIKNFDGDCNDKALYILIPYLISFALNKKIIATEFLKNINNYLIGTGFFYNISVKLNHTNIIFDIQSNKEIDEIDKIDEIDEIDEINEINEIDEIDEIDQFYEKDEYDLNEEIDEIDEIYEIDDVDEILLI